MRILILGAGGIGGYYGGRMAAGGADVTFLVRPGRAEQLRRDGLVIKSAQGDIATPVKTVLAEGLKPGWDAIVLCCKAYDLEGAIAAIRPAAAGALIVPQLNGIRHLAVLDAAFGAENVAGGLTQIGVAMDPDGTIRHLTPLSRWVHGPRHPTQAARAAALQAACVKGGFDPKLSGDIIGEMWEKFIFLCSMATMCCLLRAGVAPIARTRDGARLMLEVVEDCVAAAAGAGHPPRPAFLEGARKQLTDPASPFAASMLRDLQKGGAVEADHIIGDMLARAQALGRPATLLAAAYASLQIYQEERAKA